MCLFNENPWDTPCSEMLWWATFPPSQSFYKIPGYCKASWTESTGNTVDRKVPPGGDMHTDSKALEEFNPAALGRLEESRIYHWAEHVLERERQLYWQEETIRHTHFNLLGPVPKHLSAFYINKTERAFIHGQTPLRTLEDERNKQRETNIERFIIETCKVALEKQFQLCLLPHFGEHSSNK